MKKLSMLVKIFVWKAASCVFVLPVLWIQRLLCQIWLINGKYWLSEVRYGEWQTHSRPSHQECKWTRLQMKKPLGLHNTRQGGGMGGDSFLCLQLNKKLPLIWSSSYYSYHDKNKLQHYRKPSCRLTAYSITTCFGHDHNMYDCSR